MQEGHSFGATGQRLDAQKLRTGRWAMAQLLDQNVVSKLWRESWNIASGRQETRETRNIGNSAPVSRA